MQVNEEGNPRWNSKFKIRKTDKGTQKRLWIRGHRKTHLSLYDEVALVVNVALGISANQFAVELGTLQALAARGRGRDPAALGQVEIRRSEHFGADQGWPGQQAHSP